MAKATRYFEEGSYQRAIPLYEKGLRHNFNFEAMRCLAESYRQVRDFEASAKWYGYVVNTQYAGADDFLNYGLVLMRLRQYEQASDQFRRFASLNPRDERGPRFIQAARQNQQVSPGPLNYRIHPLPFNSAESDFCAVPYRDGLLFTSGRIKDRVVQRSNDRDGTPFLDLWMVTPKDTAGWGKPRPIKGKFNTKFHEAAACYDEAHELIFFTRNNFIGGKVKAGRDGLVKLKILYARLDEGGDWADLKSLPFNGNDYSVGHPSLSSDGEVLYFASDMPGGYGGTDLWQCALTDTGWGQPVNLGPLVNTVGDEMFPSMAADGNLYFSSNGLGGSGGLDLFMARATNQGWSDVRHLPAPINSAGDDFGYVLDASGNSGYFSSDRAGGQGKDDIYAFTILNPVLAGQVQVAESGDPLPGAMITLTDLESGEFQKLKCQSDGRFSMVVQPGRDYVARVVRDGYLDQVFRFDTKEEKAGLRIEKSVLMSQPALVLDGVARDVKTGYALSGVEVSLVPGDRRTWSALGGVFHFDLEPGGEYTLEATRPGYRPTRFTIDARVQKHVHRLRYELELQPDQGQVLLQGQVLGEDERPIEGAELFLVNRAEKTELTGTSGEEGTFSFLLEPGGKYELVATHPGYRTEQQSFEAPPGKSQVLPLNVNMASVKSGETFSLKNIYYDYGESYLRDESLPELDRLAKLMLMSPDQRIVVSSSTDSRGSDAYNLSLSQRRAESVARYLVSKGIDKERVEAIGYGETRISNGCTNGVSCTEEQHQANRRTEFTLLPTKKSKFTSNLGPNLSLPVKAPQNLDNHQAQDGNYPPLDIEQSACYRVQIGIYDSPNKADVAIQLGEVAEQLNVEPADTALYRYQLGECEIYANAKALLASARKAGFDQAFIAAYQEGKRVAIPAKMERPD